MSHTCDVCKSRVLDNKADPLSQSCGGTCLLCMVAAGDPDCAESAMGDPAVLLAITKEFGHAGKSPEVERERFEHWAFGRYFLSTIQKNDAVPQPRISGAMDMVSKNCKPMDEFTARGADGRYLEDTLNFAYWFWNCGVMQGDVERHAIAFGDADADQLGNPDVIRKTFETWAFGTYQLTRLTASGEVPALKELNAAGDAAKYFSGLTLEQSSNRSDFAKRLENGKYVLPMLDLAWIALDAGRRSSIDTHAALSQSGEAPGKAPKARA